MARPERDDTAESTLGTLTMWRMLERVAELERRVAALYERYADLFRRSPLVATFWAEMAGDERLHALIIAAAREVFPATAPALPGNWQERLADIDALLSGIESRATAGLALEEAFDAAERLEASELNTVTEFIIRQAGIGFSRLAPLVGGSEMDRHQDRVTEARQRFCGPQTPPPP
jgi:hypothetical protein